MSQNQVVVGKFTRYGATTPAQTAAYIADLLCEMELIARRDGVEELEVFLRDAREAAQKLAGRR